MPTSAKDADCGGASLNGNGHQAVDYGSVTATTDEMTLTMMDGDDNGHDRKNGRFRPRKRKLYSDICKQMEFYFSDANITKNRMMREIVEKANKTTEGFVDLSVFLEFTKIQRLAATISHIQKALVTSEKLELSSDGQKARRKVTFDPSNVKSDADVEDCTIYVENIPRDSDHEWLEKIFQAFGPVAYISLPKFKSGHHKGFGFVEFDESDAARRCLEAYGEEGACLPDDVDPAQLRSIQSFQEEQEAYSNKKKKKSSESKARKKKRKGEVTTPDADEPVAKKAKKLDDLKSSESPSSSESDTEAGMNTEEGKAKKKKRKKNKTKKTGEAKLESESIVLKVLPKKSWRQLRNRYLNLQRNNMAKLKRQLKQEQLRSEHYKNFYQHPHPHTTGAEHQGNDIDDNYSEQKTFDHIMEVKMKVPAESADCFRHKISIELAEQDEDEAMISGFIKFVDYKENDLQAYVRINSDESFSTRASNLLKKAQESFLAARFLSTREVDEYKRNVQASLRLKHKEQPRRNIRGKDRLMKAATKTNHIRFDSSEDETEDIKKEIKKEIKVEKSEDAAV